MKNLRTCLLCLTLLVGLAVPALAVPVKYTIKLADQSGVAVTGATLTSVKIVPLSGAVATTLATGLSVVSGGSSTIATGSATVQVQDAGNGDYVAGYDSEVSGEALLQLTFSKAGVVFSGGGSVAVISLTASLDSSRILSGISATGTVAPLGGSITSVTGAVGSVTAGVVVTTNNDKLGYSLTTAPPTLAQISGLFPSNISTLIVGTGAALGMVTTSNPGGAGGGLTTAQDATLTGINAKTALLTFDGLGYVNARVKAQDAAVNDAVVAALLSSVIDGTKTLKQVHAIMLSMAGGNYTTTVNTTTKVATVNYKTQAGLILTSAVVTDYNATAQPSRTVTFSNLP